MVSQLVSQTIVSEFNLVLVLHTSDIELNQDKLSKNNNK